MLKMSQADAGWTFGRQFEAPRWVSYDEGLSIVVRRAESSSHWKSPFAFAHAENNNLNSQLLLCYADRTSIETPFPSHSQCLVYGTSPAAHRGPLPASPPKPSARSRLHSEPLPLSSQHGRLLSLDSPHLSTCQRGDKRAELVRWMFMRGVLRD